MPLTPDYLNIDFNTFKNRLKTQLSKSSTFKDYDYEGSNFTTLIEMFAYISDLYTYYINKIAKNVYLDSVDLYENLYRLSTFLGYYPKGYTSGESTLTLTFSLSTSGDVVGGDQITIPAFYQLNTGLTTEDNENIYYTTTQDYTKTIPTSASNTYDIDIPLKQGIIKKLSYTGDDLIDNKLLLLEKKIDHGIYPYTIPSIKLYVDGIEWTRINNFYDISSTTDNNNVFTFDFNKNKEYEVNFSLYRNIPSTNANIEIIVLLTLGENGSIGKNKISEFEETQDIYELNSSTNLFELITKSFITNGNVTLTTDNVTLSNTASLYANNPQSQDIIKHQARNNFSTQDRNVTRIDYTFFLDDHTDIIKSNVWGEKEENPGNTNYYYKTYITIIPETWNSDTILTSATSASNWPNNINQPIIIPQSYNDTFKTTIKTYLEPKKMINFYEVFVVPQLVYFRFDIGLIIKNTYNFNTVKDAVKNKLKYYFDEKNREFEDKIDFREIHNYIFDLSKTSSSNTFSAIRGLKNLIIRDIETYTPELSAGETYIYDYNTNNNKPMYEDDPFISSGNDDNLLKTISLGYNQFPLLALETSNFINEG